MVAATATTLLAGFGLPRFLKSDSSWVASGRQAVPVLAGVALVALAAVLVQESNYHYAFCLPGDPVPMADWAKAVVLAAMAGLVAACHLGRRSTPADKTGGGGR